MKFGQLIEYDMRSIFIEKLYTKFAGETIPRTLSNPDPYLKYQNWAYL